MILEAYVDSRDIIKNKSGKKGAQLMDIKTNLLQMQLKFH